MGGPGPEIPGARLLNNGMANSNKRAQQEGTRQKPSIREQDKDKDILNGERRESWRNSPMTLGAAQIWFSAPWEEDPDDSTPHAGSDIDWVLPPSSFNPMTWTWEGLAQELDARNFPGSLVVKTLRCQCRGGRFNAWVGNYDPTRCAY